MRRALGVMSLLLVAQAAVSGQTPQAAPPDRFTLDEAIAFASEHFPAVKAALERVDASAAAVDVSRGTYLPRLDAVWQSNRATANNVFGQLFPQNVIPSMSGPVLPAASSTSVWGSAVGALFSWEPLDFGLRRAGVAGAEAALAEARAGETLTRLQVETAVAGAFLDVAAASEALAAAQADLERRDVLLRAVQVLVDNQLRPGAEASRADAERAAAATRLIQAQQRRTLAQVELARMLGLDAVSFTVSADRLLGRLPETGTPAAEKAPHPLAEMHRAEVAQARAQETELDRTDLPRVYLQSSVFARGSGASASGPFDTGVGGLSLDRANWAAGVQVQFPNVFDFGPLRARKAVAAATTRATAAGYDQALLELASQRAAAQATVDAARAIAANTPVQLAAARQSEAQARARYNSGLTSIGDVADAQGLLAQSESDDRLARLGVWRAALALASAEGDLAPFVALVRQ